MAKKILDTPRLSLTDQVTNTYRAVMKQTEKTRMIAKVRTLLSAALVIASGTVVGGSIIRHNHDNQRFTDLENKVMSHNLRLAITNINHLDTELNHISSAARDNSSTIQGSLRQITDLQSHIDGVERTLNIHIPHINVSNRNLHNQLQRVQGQIIALRVRVETVKSQLDHATLRLSQATETRTRLVHTDPLTAAMRDIQARALPCDHDAVQAACHGPLHGISCYAFLPGTENREKCEAIKPICIRCELR